MVENIGAFFQQCLVHDQLQAKLLNVGNCWPNLSVSTGTGSMISVVSDCKLAGWSAVSNHIKSYSNWRDCADHYGDSRLDGGAPPKVTHCEKAVTLQHVSPP